MKSIFYFLLCFCPLFLLAQTPPPPAFPLGLQFNDEEHNQQPTQSKFAGSKSSELPLVASLKKWCPIPGDQGKIGSCVGWSSCYGALTLQQAKADNITDKKVITDRALSAMFAYNQVKKNDIVCDGGTRFPLLLDVLNQKGTCYHKEFNVSTCTMLPDASLMQRAQQNSIKDYLSLFQTIDEPSLKIQKTKQSIAEGKPVVIGVEIKYNFLDLKKENPVWDPSKGLTLFAGGHAMCLIGYDEGKQAFEVLNSWGEKWGNDGYCWIKYEDYGKYCKYGYQLFLKETKNKENKTLLNGDFEFKVLADAATLKFNTAQVSYNAKKNYYQTVTKTWGTDQLFQLVAKNSKPDQYIYVFSIDEQRKATIHFPRNEQFQNTQFGFNETPLVSITNAEIIIPSAETAFSIGQEGTDWLVVLYSKNKIDNFSKIISKVKDEEDLTKMYNLLSYEFNQRGMPPSSIQYMPNKMSFSTQVKDDKIIPIILRVDSKAKTDNPNIIESKED